MSAPVIVLRRSVARPLDPEFNRVCFDMARHYCPAWTVGDDAPVTFEALHATMEATGGIPHVLKGFTDRSIFGSKLSALYASRAWHDALHYHLMAPFTPEGEAAVAEAHWKGLWECYPDHPRLAEWREIINALVLGQPAYERIHGTFPPSQMDFVKDWLRVRGFRA